MKSLVLLGVGLASIVSGGVLQLTGSDPAISFGSLSNPAVLTAACGVKANASINFIAQNFSVPTGYPEGDEVIAYLMNVPVGCGGVSLRQACVDTAGIRPPLWRCVWSGSEGSKSTGPVKAEHTVTSITNGYDVNAYVRCKMPAWGDFQGMTGAVDVYNLDKVAFSLGLTHMGKTVPYDLSDDEMPGRDKIIFTSSLSPPSPPPPLSPPPPTSPPPPPPPSPPQFDGKTTSTAFPYVGAADDAESGMYYVKVSSSSSKQIYIAHHGNPKKAWAMVMRKMGTTTAIHTQLAVSSPCNCARNFKLSDIELNYMTTQSNNPEVLGVILVPNYNNGYTTGNLVRSNDGSRAFPIGGGNQYNAGDMAKFNMASAGSYPTAWDTSLNTNTHCGSNQVWANWDSSEAYQFRWGANSGCSFFNENFNGASHGQDYAGHMFAFLH